jgi:hypothetical protein
MRVRSRLKANVVPASGAQPADGRPGFLTHILVNLSRLIQRNMMIEKYINPCYKMKLAVESLLRPSAQTVVEKTYHAEPHSRPGVFEPPPSLPGPVKLGPVALPGGWEVE